MATVLSRQEWGARPPRAVDHNFTKTGGIVIHHSAVSASTIRSHYPDCYFRWRAHQNFHMDTRGWNDLAYNFGVCPHAFIFEGRGWVAQNGANTPENDSTLSICIDVNGDTDTFDSQVVVAVNEMIETAVVQRGWAAKLRGHFEVSTTGTRCPGANIRRLLSEGKIHLPSEDVPLPSEPTPSGSVPLLGGDVSPLVMQDWARSKGGTDLFVSLAAPTRAISLEYGINPAVVYGIMAHETDFGRFKERFPNATLDVSHKNWAGLKVAGGGANSDPNAHQRFSTHMQGVEAVVQHVAAYAGIDLPDEILEDDRFDVVRNLGKRIASIPSDEWGWASSSHSVKVAQFAQEMI